MWQSFITAVSLPACLPWEGVWLLQPCMHRGKAVGQHGPQRCPGHLQHRTVVGVLRAAFVPWASLEY